MHNMHLLFDRNLYRKQKFIVQAELQVLSEEYISVSVLVGFFCVHIVVVGSNKWLVTSYFTEVMGNIVACWNM